MQSSDIVEVVVWEREKNAPEFDDMLNYLVTATILQRKGIPVDIDRDTGTYRILADVKRVEKDDCGNVSYFFSKSELIERMR